MPLTAHLDNLFQNQFSMKNVLKKKLLLCSVLNVIVIDFILCLMRYHVRCVMLGPVERIFLSAPVVVNRGKEANLTAVLWPSQPRTATFYWWFNNSTEVQTLSIYTCGPKAQIG